MGLIPSLLPKDWEKINKAVRTVSDEDSDRVDGKAVESSTKYSVYRVGSVVRVDLKPGGSK